MIEAARKHLMNFLLQGIRFDGRKLDEFRKTELQYGVTKNAEGSAKVKIGDTEVIAGVKMGIEPPFPDTPEEGNLIVNVELLPLSSPEFEAGPPDIEAIEIARVVDRAIREAKALDTKKMCLEPGKKVWTVFLDIVTINNDGNLIDASALAAVAAIKETKMPGYDGESIDYKKLTEEKLPIKKLPITITVAKIDNYFIIDPNSEEEKLIEARLTIGVTKEGRICAIQKGGTGLLSIEEVEKMIELAVDKSKEIAMLY